MYKKALTLDDLVKFCKSEKIQKFDAEQTGYSIRVQIPATFSVDEQNSDSTLFGFIQVMHTGRNRNASSLTEDAAKECMKTLAYKPLLANFCEIDGVKDFTSHDFTVDEDGNTVYQERQIGCFTADEPYMEDDKKVKGRKNIFARVAIPREYSDAAEIIERKNGTKVSAELEIFQFSYDAKEKLMLLESAELIGCTCLGIDPDTGTPVEEGMEGSHIQLEDFSCERNGSNFILDDKVKKFIKDSIEEAFNNINQNLTKGGNTEAMNLFEQLLEKYGVTAEDVTFEYENLSDEELTAKFEEAFAADGDEEAATEDDSTETPSEDSATMSEDTADTESEENIDVQPEEDTYEMKCELTMGDKKREFSLSLKEKLNALFTLVNETYGESDNEFYDIDVDDEAKEVYMLGYFTGKNYKQKYSTKKDVYSLQGDRVPVYAKFLTEDQIKQLDQMKANYSEIQDKLAKYEAEPQKMEILNNECFAQVAETAEFVELKKQDVHFDLSVEEVQSRADQILLNAAKNGAVTFAQANVPAAPFEVKSIPVTAQTTAKKPGRYGGMFSK